ncbi:hypothetical protein NPIL_431231 [Nephila pilipes]|uniref:Uncharacterized protein n=1 Tax=Nephila pilipes TaxID=299642 RepID=A0A8X6K4A7_NEPPI|nr:hypothetical protein NPIL_431231 [Nephila pilipes]
MKRMSSSMIVSSKRVCFNYDTKEDSSFFDDTVPLHHFLLSQDIYAAKTYFANTAHAAGDKREMRSFSRLHPGHRVALVLPERIQHSSILMWSVSDQVGKYAGENYTNINN